MSLDLLGVSISALPGISCVKKLASDVRHHAWEVHGMPLSHDEALLLLFHAELAGATAFPARPQTAAETEER
jgi:hypothetical protein